MVEPRFEWDNAHDIANMRRRLEEISNAVDQSLGDSGEVIGIGITTEAKRIVPVDTGKLRASIDYQTDEPGDMVVRIMVGTDVRYSIFVEATQPYLRPAVNNNRNLLRSEIEKALRSI